MPDFTSEGSKDFWAQRRDNILCRILAAMESVEEGWAFDGDEEIEAAVEHLSAVLDDFAHYELAEEDKLIDVLSALHSGRALRILQHLDALQPGAASKLLVFAESASKDGNAMADFFLNRNLVFERKQLLGRIFAAERVAIVKRVLDVDV